MVQLGGTLTQINRSPKDHCFIENIFSIKNNLLFPERFIQQLIEYLI